MNKLFLLCILALGISCKSSKPVEKPQSPLVEMQEKYGKQLATKDSDDGKFTMALLKKNDNNFEYMMLTVVDNKSNKIIYNPSQRIKSADWVSNNEVKITIIPGISKASGDSNTYTYNLLTKKQISNE